jgi:hypothetical protein
MKDGSTSISGVNQPTEDEIIVAVATHLEAPEAVALSWLTSFARNFDSKAAAERLARRHGDAGQHP